jgi:hypothetical protein
MGQQIKRKLKKYMSKKIELLYKKLTGIDPRKDLEPPLIGQALLKALRKVRSGEINTLTGVTIESVSILDSGIEAHEPYFIMQATLSNNKEMVTYQCKPVPHQDMLRETAERVPPSEWIIFDPAHPAESGI